MSYTFATSTLAKLRWFSMPAFAVIAVSGTVAFLGDKAIDAYSARFKPHTVTVAEPPPDPIFASIGSAEKRGIKADSVSWSVTLTVDGKTEADARRALAPHREQLARRLLDSGVALADLEIATASTTERFKSVTRRDREGLAYDEEINDGYDASADFTVRSHDVAGVVRAYKALMITPPLGVEVTAPECHVSDDTELRAALERTATADAGAKAERTADQLAGKAGKLISISMQGTEYVPQASTWTCTDGLTLRANVHAMYKLR